MKTNHFLSVFLLLLAASIHAGAVGFSLPPSPASIRLTATFQSDLNRVISASTNHTSTSTNTIVTRKWSTTNMTLVTFDALKMLTNSFHTNFPSGARLFFRNTRFYVMDKTGTNVVLDVSSVMSASLRYGMRSNYSTVITTSTNGGTAYSSNDYSDMSYAGSFNYDDSNLVTTDGTHTKFRVYGIWRIKDSSSYTTTTQSTRGDFLFTGSGGGTLRDKTMVLSGQISGAGSSKSP